MYQSSIRRPPNEDEHLNQETIMLTFLIVTVMSIFSISLLIIMIKRSMKINRFKIYQVFFIIIFYIATKILTCTILLIKIIAGIPTHWDNVTAGSLELLFKDSLIFSEMSLVELFLVSFQYYVYLCLNPIVYFQPLIPKFNKISMIFQIIYFISTSMFLLLFNIGVLNYEVINIVAVSINSLLIIIFIASFFYLTFQMTGIMLSKRRHTRMNKTYKLLLLLFFSRVITSTIEWLIHFEIKDGNFSGFIHLIKVKQGNFVVQSVIFVGYIVFILLTEGLPLVYCIRSSVISVFFKAGPEEDGLGLLHDDALTQDLNNENKNKSSYTLAHSILETGSPQITELNSFTDIEPLPMRSTIWGYYKGSFKNKLYFVRKSNEKISHYLLEDAAKQIIEYREKNIRELNPMGYFQEQQFFFIFEPFRHQNLDSYIRANPNMKSRLSIMQLIALSISILHENGVVHGCLCPSNIFIVSTSDGSSQRIVFSGYGLHSFKRYLSMTVDYSNKTTYSAVEHLENRNAVIIKPKKQADSYSFGMILYEVLTDNKGYRELSLKQLEKKMCEENTRPKIPQDMQPELKNLIRKCWSKETNLRPTMTEISFELKEVIKNKFK